MNISNTDIDPSQPPLTSDDPLEYIAKGQVYAKNGRFTEAASCFETALALNPNLPMAHNNLGWILQCQGDRNGALLCYRRALDLKGSFRLAQINLAALLSDMGLNAEAQPIWKALVSSYPSDRALLDRVISVNLRAGDVPNASELAEQYALLTRGSQWCQSNTKEIPVPEVPFPAPLLSVCKLKHDIEQFSYLRGLGILGNDLTQVIDGYRRVLERIKPLGDSARVELGDGDRELIGHVYSRLVHLRPTPRVKGALSTAWKPESVEKEYLGSPLGLVVVDSLLSEEALQSLRSFCLESTVWFANSYAYGRLGAFFREGFNCPLLVQIVEELRIAFPRVIVERHPLLQLWGFKNDYFQPQTGAHADFAAVNVNIWLTPEEADRGAGGLVVYDVEAPADWDFATYNRGGAKSPNFSGNDRRAL